ncbi:MAG TPA: hypothetical protein VMN35_08420 [Gaiellaceae bacterium]|nr:hypothetical protein [Gaiellaceae bacterium]
MGLVLAVPGSATSGDGLRMHVHDVRLSDVARKQLPARAEASWCGTPAQDDRRPNVIAGRPVHWVYALPVDGADALASFADAMQTDAEVIDVWWKTQDPTRTPRNDLAQFPCGAQIDLTTLRLPQSGQQLAGGGRFGIIANGLQAAGLRSSFTKYVVYYDGPVLDAQICGQGGSDRTGFGLAVVYARACAGVSTAVVAAHELLHTFGAVASGAPNECTGEHDAHVCDDERDLLYPFIDESPLEAKLLDVGRDDYYGHGGSWTDTRSSPWLFQLDGQVPLSLSLAGPGSVGADVPGLECALTCTTTWNAGTQLALTASPRPGAKLVRWGGGCTGAVTCNVTLAQAATVSALFAPLSYRLSVRVTGQGTVRSRRPGITCRPRCSSAFPSHVPLRLTAKAATGWRLRAWAGACRGTRLVCTVPMTRAAQARATFVRVRR